MEQPSKNNNEVHVRHSDTDSVEISIPGYSNEEGTFFIKLETSLEKMDTISEFIRNQKEKNFGSFLSFLNLEGLIYKEPQNQDEKDPWEFGKILNSDQDLPNEIYKLALETIYDNKYKVSHSLK